MGIKYTKSDLDREILITGKDAIPAKCPGTCQNVPYFNQDVIAYGRRVFCRQKRALAFPTKEMHQSLITVEAALQSTEEGILSCDEIIRETMHRKELLEADRAVLIGVQA